MVHWRLDVHAIDRDDSSVLKLHHHVLQGGQTECYWARAYGLLIISTLEQNTQIPHIEREKKESRLTEDIEQITCTFSIMTEKLLSTQSLDSRYWQWPVKVKNLLSNVLKWDWPTTRHSPGQRERMRNSEYLQLLLIVFNQGMSSVE